MKISSRNAISSLLLLGLFLNISIYLIAGLLLNKQNFLDSLSFFVSDTLFSIIFHVFTFGAALIPYVILGIIWKERGNLNHKYTTAGLIGALTFIVLNNIFFYGVYFMDLFSDDPSSTGGLAFFAYLFYTPFVAIFGYLIGKGIYGLRNKLNKS